MVTILDTVDIKMTYLRKIQIFQNWVEIIIFAIFTQFLSHLDLKLVKSIEKVNKCCWTRIPFSFLILAFGAEYFCFYVFVSPP